MKEGRGGRGEKTEVSGRKMEAEISQGRPKAHRQRNASHAEILGGGTKIRKLWRQV